MTGSANYDPLAQPYTDGARRRVKRPDKTTMGRYMPNIAYRVSSTTGGEDNRMREIFAVKVRPRRAV